MIEVIILGCGASSGVPIIGCNCSVCTSEDPKNKRTRSSIIIKQNGSSLLIDTSPDLRQQVLREKINKIDAVLYTHAHADHLSGIDDLRAFNHLKDDAIQIYSNQETIDYIEKSFGYVFKPLAPNIGWYKPLLIPNLLEYNKIHNIAGMKVIPFREIHGQIDVIGIRIDDFAYSTDLNIIPEESLEMLKGLKLWVVDCIRYDSAPTHAGLDQVLKWVEILRPEKVILTHMTHVIDYNEISAKLFDSMKAAYDGMRIIID